jgi:hypothetical protein
VCQLRDWSWNAFTGSGIPRPVTVTGRVFNTVPGAFDSTQVEQPGPAQYGDRAQSVGKPHDASRAQAKGGLFTWELVSNVGR